MCVWFHPVKHTSADAIGPRDMTWALLWELNDLSAPHDYAMSDLRHHRPH